MAGQHKLPRQAQETGHTTARPHAHHARWQREACLLTAGDGFFLKPTGMQIVCQDRPLQPVLMPTIMPSLKPFLVSLDASRGPLHLLPVFVVHRCQGTLLGQVATRAPAFCLPDSSTGPVPASRHTCQSTVASPIQKGHPCPTGNYYHLGACRHPRYQGDAPCSCNMLQRASG